MDLDSDPDPDPQNENQKNPLFSATGSVTEVQRPF